ncbi:MAG TPA: hypothetical protein VF989_00685 [Polyangiaceae bacterium]
MKAEWVLGLVYLGVACGGRVQPGSNDGNEPAPASERGFAGESSEGDTGGSPEVELGECVKGVPIEDVEACAWLGSDDRCYETKEEACACICPRRDGTICTSGFPNGPNGRTPVRCR